MRSVLSCLLILMAGCTAPAGEPLASSAFLPEPIPIPAGFEPVCPDDASPTNVCAAYMSLAAGHVLHNAHIIENPSTPGRWVVGGDLGTQAAISIPSPEAVLDYARATVFWQDSNGDVSQHQVPPRSGASVPNSDRVWANSEYLRDFAVDPDGQLLALTYSTGSGSDRFTSRAIVSSFDANTSFSAIDERAGTTSRMSFASDDGGRWFLSPCRAQCTDVNTYFLRDAHGTWSDLPLPPQLGVCEESVAVAHGAKLGLACMRASSGGWGDAFYFLEAEATGFSNVTGIDDADCGEMQGNVAPDGSIGLMGARCSVATDAGDGDGYWFARSSHNWTSWEIYAPLHESALGSADAGADIHSAVMDASGIFHIAYTPYPPTGPDPELAAAGQLWYVAWDPARGVELASVLLDENNVPPGLLWSPAGKLRSPAMAVMADGSIAIAWGHGDGFAVATMAPVWGVAPST